MQEKLGEIQVTYSRYRTDVNGRNLKTYMIFDVERIARLARANIGDRVMAAYGTGNRLGHMRIYFNREDGPKLSVPGGKATKTRRLQFTVTGEGEFPLFFKAHTQDVSSLELTATLWRAGIHIYLELAMPAATYDEATFRSAVEALPGISGMEGWRMYDSPTLRARRAGQLNRVDLGRKTKKTVTFQPASKAITAPLGGSPTTTAGKDKGIFASTSPTLTLDKEYIILKQDDGDLYIRRSVVNIDVFKVVDGKPRIKLRDGSEVTLPITPGELVTAFTQEGAA